jgi:hypothetical protein
VESHGHYPFSAGEAVGLDDVMKKSLCINYDLGKECKHGDSDYANWQVFDGAPRDRRVVFYRLGFLALSKAFKWWGSYRPYVSDGLAIRLNLIAAGPFH